MSDGVSVQGDSGSKDIWADLQMILNDLKGGQAKVTLMMKNEDGVFEQCTGDDAVKGYNGEDTDEPIWFELHTHVNYPGYETPDFTFKIKVDYTYPDGTEGSYETEEIVVHTANYMSFNSAYGNRYGMNIDEAAHTVSVDLIVDGERIADPDAVSVEYESLTKRVAATDDYGTSVTSAAPDIVRNTGSDGNQHITLTYTLSDAEWAELEGYNYIGFFGAFSYPEESGREWSVTVEKSEPIS